MQLYVDFLIYYTFIAEKRSSYQEKTWKKASITTQLVEEVPIKSMYSASAIRCSGEALRLNGLSFTYEKDTGQCNVYSGKEQGQYQCIYQN